MLPSRSFGPTGRSVPIIGQGTWKIDHGDRAAAVAALRHGLDLGLTHVDTAEMYGDAELIVARAIEGRRDEVFLVSKVLPSNASRTGTMAACERSLRRLGTDRLDCYLLHWPGAHPLEDTVAAFEALKRDGKILSWGVSNFDEDELDALWRVEHGNRVACNQVLYHLGERAIEHAVVPWCESRNVAVVAYSPFGQDDFPAARSSGGRILQSVAQRHNATPRQVALAFLTRHASVFAIPKASRRAHVEENAGVVALTDKDVDDIGAAFPRRAKPRSLPML